VKAPSKKPIGKKNKKPAGPQTPVESEESDSESSAEEQSEKEDEMDVAPVPEVPAPRRRGRPKRVPVDEAPTAKKTGAKKTASAKRSRAEVESEDDEMKPAPAKRVSVAQHDREEWDNIFHELSQTYGLAVDNKSYFEAIVKSVKSPPTHAQYTAYLTNETVFARCRAAGILNLLNVDGPQDIAKIPIIHMACIVLLLADTEAEEEQTKEQAKPQNKNKIIVLDKRDFVVADLLRVLKNNP
jgi:hypothetical protein